MKITPLKQQMQNPENKSVLILKAKQAKQISQNYTVKYILNKSYIHCRVIQPLMNKCCY